MLATLAIINMAVAAVLITDTLDDSNTTEPTAIVATVDTSAQQAENIYWVEE